MGSNLSKDSSIFTDKPIRSVIRISLPVFTGMLVHFLYTVVDTFWISRIDPSDPGLVGGTGLVFPLILFVTAISSGISIGCNGVVARSRGGGESDVLASVIKSGLFVATISTFIILIPPLLFSEQIFHLLQAEGTFFEHGHTYFRSVIPVIVFLFFSAVCNGILQGEGLVTVVMRSMIISTVANLILDPLFIFNLSLGVRGAGYATVVAQFLGFTYSATSLYRHFRSSGEDLLFSKRAGDRRGEILTVGLPQSLGQIIMAIGVLLLNRLMIGLDPNAMTALALTQRVDTILFIPIFAVGSGLVTLISYCHGAGDYQRAMVLWRKATGLTVCTVLITATTLVISAPLIYRIFTDVPEVHRYAVLQTRVVEYTFITAVYGILGRSVFQAMERPGPALFLTLLRLMILGVPSAYIYVHIFDLGVVGVWLGLITGNIASGLLSFIWVERLLKSKMEESCERV